MEGSEEGMKINAKEKTLKVELLLKVEGNKNKKALVSEICKARRPCSSILKLQEET